MIYFTEIGQYGRLGNQLFQYAAARSLALHHNTEVALGDLDNKSWHNQKCLLSNFNLQYVKVNGIPNIPTYYEPVSNYWKFDSNFFSMPNEINLHGFFQHIKYFEPFKYIIDKELQFKDKSLEDNCIKFLSKFRNPVSIHLRLGDTLEQFRSRGYESYLKDYVSNACKLFDSDRDFLVISGGSRNSDNSEGNLWARKNIVGKNFHYIEDNDTLTDFCLIKNCEGNILGIDSTFSWWASYLNKNGQVVAPKVMPYSSMSSEVQDWVLI